MGRIRIPARTGVQAAVVAIAVVMITSAACTNGSDEPATGQLPTSGDVGTSVAVDPGLLRLPATGELSADPLTVAASDPTALITLDVLYDGITTYRSGLVERDGTWVMADEPALELATALEPNADATVWTIRLGDRAFSDGSPIGASDVKASLEYLARPGVRSLAGVRLSVVQGYDELVSGSAEELSGIAVIDDKTVEVSLRQPFPDLPALLASPLFGILPARAVEDGLFVWEQLTSGAYAVNDEADDGRWIRVARRPGFDTGPAAIELRVFDDWQVAHDAFSRGELDWSPVPDGVDAAQLEDAARASVTPANVSMWLALPAVAPFQDPAVREALARLISAEQLRGDTLPNSLRLRGLVPAGIDGHLADTCGRLCQPDRDAALELLRERFPAGLPEVTVSVLDDPSQRAFSDQIVRVLGEAGVPARLESLTLEQWVEAIEQPLGQLRVAGGVGIAPTQDDSLAAFLATDGVVASLVDPELATQLARARAEPDRERRVESYRELERRIMSHAIVLPVAQLQLRHAVASRVGGWSPRLDGSVDLSSVRVDDGTG